jgi:hypothetical protein
MQSPCEPSDISVMAYAIVEAKEREHGEFRSDEE